MNQIICNGAFLPKEYIEKRDKRSKWHGVHLHLDEPGADLPVVLAIASSYRDTPVDKELVAIGEVGLTGEIRTVRHINQRLSEVARLGFKRCILPKNCAEKLEIPENLTVYPVKNLAEAIEMALS